MENVLDFWFEETEPAQWWKKDIDFDGRIRERFLDIHSKAARCELYHWRKSARGKLAEIIVLDQFSRNMFRDTPAAFAHDPLALALAQEAVAQGADTRLSPREKSFLYLPFMHSESSAIHEIAVTLYNQPGMESNLEWEIKHKDIIDRFGRYPHRNTILGRTSTDEELVFLKKPGSRF